MEDGDTQAEILRGRNEMDMVTVVVVKNDRYVLLHMSPRNAANGIARLSM